MICTLWMLGGEGADLAWGSLLASGDSSKYSRNLEPMKPNPNSTKHPPTQWPMPIHNLTSSRNLINSLFPRKLIFHVKIPDNFVLNFRIHKNFHILSYSEQWQFLLAVFWDKIIIMSKWRLLAFLVLSDEKFTCQRILFEINWRDCLWMELTRKQFLNSRF